MSGQVQRDRLLFQYRNSSRLITLINGLFNLVDQSNCKDLERFYDIDEAEGYWLTILARIFNVVRDYSDLGANVFRLDFSPLDTGYILDGSNTPIDDNVLRALVKARIKRNTATVKSVEFIIDQFVSVINPNAIEVVDGDKTLTINLYLDFENAFVVNASLVNGTNVINGAISYDSWQKIFLLNALRGIDEKWFGCPSGVSVVQYNYLPTEV